MSDATYRKNVGKLATDRYDFEKHLEGTSFRHFANQIDLSPLVVVDGYSKSTVQDAIKAISEIAFPPTIQDATASVNGVIRLAGDISGTASNPSVVGIYNRPISSSAPSMGSVITWDGYYWTPQAASNAFTAGGDLSGTNLSQNVITITGQSNTAQVLCGNLRFDRSLNYVNIWQYAANTNNSGVQMSIMAQSGTGSGMSGGDLLLVAGEGDTTGLDGSVSVGTRQGQILVDIVEVSKDNRVLGLYGRPGVSRTPSGSNVIYIGDAISAPTTSPSYGAILYSDGGKLNITESDGTNFVIGSIPNPNNWGPTRSSVKTFRFNEQTTNSVQKSMSTMLDGVSQYITMTQLSSTRVDAIIIGKVDGYADTLQCNMSATYVWSPTDGYGIPVGSLTITDMKQNGSAVSWSTPYIVDVSSPGSTIIHIYTGAYSATVINWMAVVQVTTLGDIGV